MQRPDTIIEIHRERVQDQTVEMFGGDKYTESVDGTGYSATATLDLTLDHGLLTLDPLEFDFPQGRLAGKVRLDARKDPVVSDLDMRLTGLGLQQMLPGKNGAPPAVEGVMQARAVLHGQGDTVHDAASAANGRVVMVVPHGKIRQAFAELMGINVANGLYLLLSKDPRQTPLRCLVEWR